MIYYFGERVHLRLVDRFLSSGGKALDGAITLVPYDALLKNEARFPERAALYIFSGLQRFASMPEEARGMLAALHARLVKANGTARVLNDPSLSFGRYDLLRLLHREGINRFNVYRLAEPYQPMRFPVFIRKELGTQNRLLPLLRNRLQYESARNWARLRGTAGGKIAVEFCATADAAGVYRKYGAFVVGDRIVPRHLFFSSKWMVKEARIATPELLAEEIAYLENNPHAEALKRCAKLAHISYGRIDYSLLNGEPQIWEVNRSPSIAGGSSEKIPARQAATQRFVSKFVEVLTAFDDAADVVIRRMQTADRPQVMEILAQWNMAPVQPSANVPDPERSDILVENSFVATAHGRLIGVASYILHGDGFAETASLAVDYAFRGRNVGERLQTARLIEMKARGVVRLQTEADRPETIEWYQRKYGYRIVGKNPKRHSFGRADIDHWTVLELNLDSWKPGK